MYVCMECQHLTCTNYSLPKILSLVWFCLLFAIFQKVSDSVTSTGFPLTTEYSTKSLKTLATCQPSYLYNLLQVYHPSRALRSSTQQLLHAPYMSTDFGWCAFSYTFPATWNSIPISIKKLFIFVQFQAPLKVLLYSPAY